VLVVERAGVVATIEDAAAGALPRGRGWDMTAQVRELAGLPARLLLDGELLGKKSWAVAPTTCFY
jgi:hypothetical protein